MAFITGTRQAKLNLSVRRLEAQDLARPELWNPQFQELLHNDATLEDRLQNLGDTYMPKVGGTFSGTLELANGKALKSRTVGGELVDLVVLDEDGDIVLGSTSRRARLHSSVDPIAQVGDKAYTLLHTGNHAGEATGVHGVAAPYRVAKTSNAEGFVPWSEIKDRPASLPPGPHTHNDLYYTKTESQSRYLNQYSSGQVRGNLMVGDTQYNNPPKITLALGDDDTGLQWIAPGEFSLESQNNPIAVVSYGGIGVQSGKFLKVGGKNVWHQGNLEMYENTYNLEFDRYNSTLNNFDADTHRTLTVTFPGARKGDYVLVAPPDADGFQSALQVYGFVEATDRIRITAQHHTKNANMLVSIRGWRVSIIRFP